MSSVDPLSKAIAGVIGACYASTCVHPIEVVRTRIQAGNKQYSGLIDGLIQIAKSEGLAGLFSGLSSQYTQTAMANFIFFYFYPVFLKVFRPKSPPSESIDQQQENNKGKKQEQKSNGLQYFMASLCAAIVQVLVMTPINVATTRIKTGASPADQTGSLVGVVRLIIQKEGFASAYGGLGPSLILTLNPGIEFTASYYLQRIYDYLKQRFSFLPDSSSSAVHFVVAALAKLVATVTTYPYILAKVRMQNAKSDLGSVAILFQIIRTQGFLGLFTGMQIQIIKAMLFSSFRSMALEKVLHTVVAVRKSLS